MITYLIHERKNGSTPPLGATRIPKRTFARTFNGVAGGSPRRRPAEVTSGEASGKTSGDHEEFEKGAFP